MKGRARKARANTDMASDVALAFYQAIANLSRADLRRLDRSAAACNKINCWWLTYRLAPAIREVAGNELQFKPPRSRGGSKRKRAAAGGKEAK